MEQVSDLITQKLKTTAEAEDHGLLWSKRKAITTFLPHAVWQERSGRPEALDTILHVARASRKLWFRWHRVDKFASTLLSEATPRAAALASPHIPWDRLTDGGDLIQQWAAVAPVAPDTEEVAQSVVDVLLQIASVDELVPYIPTDLWSRLAKCPPLPPICQGRHLGTRAHVIDAVWALKDISVFKSYLLVVWSEWDHLYPDGLDKMHTFIRKGFGGIGMEHYRAELIGRLDHVLGELDRAVESPKPHNLDLHRFDPLKGIDQYGSLRETLLQMNAKAISCTPRLTITLTVY